MSSFTSSARKPQRLSAQQNSRPIPPSRRIRPQPATTDNISPARLPDKTNPFAIFATSRLHRSANRDPFHIEAKGLQEVTEGLSRVRLGHTPEQLPCELSDPDASLPPRENIS
jgi:hypothetical protein